MFKDLKNELAREFGDEGMKILLLSSLTGIYPLLEKMGFKISAPLAITVDSEEMLPKLIRQLSGFSGQSVTPISVRPKELKKVLEEAEYGISCFRFLDSRYTQYNLETIVTECHWSELEISKVKLFIMFVVGKVPRKYQDFFEGNIYFKGLPLMGKSTGIDAGLKEDFLKKFISFCLCHTPEIKKIGENVEIEDGTFYTLAVAAEILKLFLGLQALTQEEVNKLKIEIDDMLNEIREKWENAEEPEAYAVAFRRALYDDVARIENIFNREHLPGDATNSLETSLLFDKEFYYLPYTLFCKISEGIVGEGNLDYIKSQLVDAGMVIAEGNSRTYFSKKIEIVSAYGRIMRRRLVKMPMDKIDNPGELTLLERIAAEKGGEHDGYRIGKNAELDEMCESYR